MKKILIIDQKPFSRTLLKNDLAVGYQVFEAQDYEETKTLLQQEHVDLILLDMDRAENDGAEICTNLKDQTLTENTPLILLSSYNQKEDIISGLYSGADDYLTKPIYPNELFARIDTHLRVKNYYSDLEKEDLMMLLELTEFISVSRNPKKILRYIVEKLALIIDVSRCSIIGLNDEGELIVRASSDLDANSEVKIDLDNYPEIRKALLTSRPVFVQNVTNSSLLEPVKDKINMLKDSSLCIVPIIKKQNIIGTFFLRTATPLKSDRSARVLKLCQLVANISGNALENAILFESMQSSRKLLEELAYRDSLTGLYNHRQFHARFEEEYSRAKRYGLALSCVFIDIDDFKNINDQHGHIVGDVVLKQFGKLIERILRKSDIAGRLGGDEFAVILPNTLLPGAHIFVERLTDEVKKISIKSLKSGCVDVSVGVSTYYNDDDIKSYEDLIDLADKDMYRQKSEKASRPE